jgi:predicted dehydrogenase
MEGSLSILGEKGSVVLGGYAVNHISHWKFINEEPVDADIQKHYSQDVPNVYGHGHTPYLADVMEAILQNKPAAVEGEEGRKNIAILTALYESAASNGAPIAPGTPSLKSKLGKR